MLAMRYNTTVEAILRANPGLNPDNLQIGQVICIPKEGDVPECEGVYYRVRIGDTLYSISRMFNVSIDDLLKANPGIDPMNLRVGELICIPKVTPPPKPCPGGHIYEVGANDNLVTILVRFNISYMDLMQSNKDMDIDNLMPGHKLCIMPHMDWGCPCPMGSKSYRILPSDIPADGLTVVYLAKKVNTSVDVLMNINANFRPTDFTVGRVICIPA